jgi:AraC family transcriptional regulator
MDFPSRMTEVVDYIEDHISDDIDLGEVAKIVCCSAYQFGRIFSYVVGISMSEYIRRRRLSLAALELQASDVKVIDVALRYGYNSPDSFARAFREMHGITPRESCALGVRLRMFPRITFHISIKGDADMEYRIEQKQTIKIVGVVKNFGKWEVNQHAKNWQAKMGDIWLFWDHFLSYGANLIIRDKYKLYRTPFWQIGVTQTLDNGDTVVAIGAESDGRIYPELDTYEIPANTWAVFTAKGKLNQEVHPIAALMTRVLSEWLPSSGYVKSMNCELEVYGPGNTQSDDYTCEVWIPVKKK